jgi:putative nucleotidyltransferase with HDIG domain
MNEELRKAILTTGDLPPMPVVATKVLQLVESGKADAAEISRTISSDPAVSARILKISNSTFYGCRRKIQTLSEAVVVLGHNTIKGLAVAASVKEIYRPSGLIENMLWEHSFGGALAAQIVAGHTSHVSADEAFLAGLFHDIGKIIMNLKERDKFRQVIERCYNEMLMFEEVELTVFPYTHAELGGYVLEKWNLPESLINAVMLHHSFAFDDDEDIYQRNLTAIASLADLICLKLGIGTRQALEDLDLAKSKAAETLELDEARLELIKDSVAEHYLRDKGYFNS